ncbi:MAG: hypothetical protein WBG43_11870 [Marinifilaceae bacterium]
MNKIFIGVLTLIASGLTSCSVENSASEDIQKSLTGTVTFNAASFGFPAANTTKSPEMARVTPEGGIAKITDLPKGVKTINVKASQRTDKNYDLATFIATNKETWKLENVRFGVNTFTAHAQQKRSGDKTWTEEWERIVPNPSYVEGFEVAKEYVGTKEATINTTGDNNFTIDMELLNSVLRFDVAKTNKDIIMALRATVTTPAKGKDKEKSISYTYDVKYTKDVKNVESIFLNTVDLVAGSSLKLDLLLTNNNVLTKKNNVLTATTKIHNLLNSTIVLEKGKLYTAKKAGKNVVITDKNFKEVTIIDFTWEQLQNENIDILLPL